MGDGPTDDIGLRRRREGRTDYGDRLEMLKSGEHRAVIRLSNDNAQVQVIGYAADGDRTVTAATGDHLEAYGWDHHAGNIPAAYLAGFLAGKRALDEGIDTVIPDLGLYRRERGSRHYAAVQGLRDAGLDLNADEAVFPAEERIRGEHADAYESDGMTETFEKVRDAIEDEYGG